MKREQINLACSAAASAATVFTAMALGLTLTQGFVMGGLALLLNLAGYAEGMIVGRLYK